MKRTACLLTLTLALVALAAPALATTVDAETEARVPALSAFHEVIYPLWHEAWPKKDVDALVALGPKIDTGVAEIAKAELPGILRDKKPAWDAAVVRLKAIAAEYGAAAGKKDGPALLAAAESGPIFSFSVAKDFDTASSANGSSCLW